MNRRDRRRLQRQFGFDDGPVDIVEFDDGSIEVVIGGLSACCCPRCAMLRDYQALKSDGPPRDKATRQFEHSSDEVRYDDQAS